MCLIISDHYIPIWTLKSACQFLGKKKKKESTMGSEVIGVRGNEILTTLSPLIHEDGIALHVGCL